MSNSKKHEFMSMENPEDRPQLEKYRKPPPPEPPPDGELEELTDDIAMAIEKGFKHWNESNYWEPRFTTEVVSPSQINVIDQDGAEYTLVVSRK